VGSATSICFGSHVGATDTVTLLIKASATVTVYRGHRRAILPARDYLRVAYMKEKKNKILPGFPSVTTARSAPKMCQASLNNVLKVLQISSKSLHFRRSYSRTREHRQTRRKVNPIFGWSVASSRIIIFRSRHCCNINAIAYIWILTHCTFSVFRKYDVIMYYL